MTGREFLIDASTTLIETPGGSVVDTVDESPIPEPANSNDAPASPEPAK